MGKVRDEQVAPALGNNQADAPKGKEADVGRDLRNVSPEQLQRQVQRQGGHRPPSTLQAPTTEVVKALMDQLVGLRNDPTGLARVAKKAAQRSQKVRPSKASGPGKSQKVPSKQQRENPLTPYSPNAQAATYSRGSGLPERFSHTPWGGGRDGANLPTSGKPFKFQGEGFSLKKLFSNSTTDIPLAWVQDAIGEWISAVINRPFDRTWIALGRYDKFRA